MDAEALEAAAELCRLVQAEDLLSWLELGKGATPDEARAALDRARRRMQSMQGNPKFKDAARHLLKTHRKLEELLADPAAYHAAIHRGRAAAQVPLLELAIDGVLADGALTSDEEAFLRQQAARLGIDEALYEATLARRCAARGTTAAQARAAVSPSAVPASTTGVFRVERALQAPHRTAGTGWWDDGFTRLLLRLVPQEARRVVDLSCGLGWSALALLPQRPSLEWLGVAPTQPQVDLARRNLGAAGLSARVALKLHPPHALPLPDGAVDLLLCVMSLHEVGDTRPVFAEAARLLAPGGRLVVVEPDSAGQRSWFDRGLQAFNPLFQRLCERVDEVVRSRGSTSDPAGQPSFSLGPELGARMAAAGLEPSTTVLHPVQLAQQTTFPAFARRLRRRVEALREAGGLPPQEPALVAVEQALGELEASSDPAHVGTGVHLLPLFATVGVKPGWTE